MPDVVSVANSSCLIALEAIGRLDLLLQLYGTMVIPRAVAAECGSFIPAWCDIRDVTNQAMVQSLRFQLGPGESEVIALPTEIAATRLILDDKKARHIARQLNLPVTGTVAVLLQAKQRGLVAGVSEILEELTSAGFHLSKSLADEARRIAGE